METMATALFFLGTLFSVVGTVWFLLEAFQENVLWGLGCLLLPFVSLFFLILHWNKAGAPFLLQLISIAPIVGGLYLGYVPS